MIELIDQTHAVRSALSSPINYSVLCVEFASLKEEPFLFTFPERAIDFFSPNIGTPFIAVPINSS